MTNFQTSLPLASPQALSSGEVKAGSDFIRALSLNQPWASLLILGEKRFETRSRRMNFRGRLAIHACKGFPRQAQELCSAPFFKEALARHGYKSWEELPFGKMLGFTEVVACDATEVVALAISDQERAFGIYDAGRFAIKLGVPSRLKEPISCHGAQSLWRVPEGIAATMVAELCGDSK